MRIYGVTGWKNAGKTSLVTRLVTEFVDRGLRVSTVKHAHHAVDIDQPGRDSFRHRAAGATEVMLAAAGRWALMHELRDEAEWELADLIRAMQPVDLLIVEGFKMTEHPKIEVWRPVLTHPPMALSNTSIRAIAGDPTGHDVQVPVLDLDDTAAIADFIWADLGVVK